MIKIKYILFIVLLLTAAAVEAQENEMLIEQIAGKKITRESFNADGKLIGKQEFIVDKLVQNGEEFAVKISTKIYDIDGNLKSIYTTEYSCKPDESGVLLSIFTVNPKQRKISVSVNSRDFKNLYDLESNEMLESINLTMYVESGILNFLGSKNKVEIHNRKLIKENDNWKITEEITVKSYLSGIQIKKINYSVTEYLTTSGQMEKQIFKESSGEYFTIKIQ